VTELRIAFAGTPEFAVPALRALVESPNTVVGVLTQPDRPSGRGRKLAASPVKEAALKYDLPIAQPLTLKDEAARAQLAAWKPDVLVVVAYGLILPREVLALPRLGCVNIHASLLPRWRGAAPIQRAILAGDAETGVTIMLMDAGLDTGPVLLQKRAPLSPQHTSSSLHAELAELGAPALLEALEGLGSGTLRAKPQPTEGVTYASKIDKGEALIDWNEDALAIERKVRAFNPWPGAETRFAGEPLKIATARLPQGSIEHSGADFGLKSPPYARTESLMNQSGSIIGLQEDAILVRCGRGSLAITEVQRPGRRRISAVDFAHGYNLTGQRFGE